MTFIPHTALQRAEMLEKIGVADFAELVAAIPPSLRLNRDLDVPPAHGEIELNQAANALLQGNTQIPTNRVFAGGGIYPHHIPAAIDALASRGEFLSAYTPYQPEVSQGLLQCIYEYQSYICMLTGMDVSNASGYDGATTLADAVLMAKLSFKGKRMVLLIAPHVNPNYADVVLTYNHGAGMQIEQLSADEAGSLSLASLTANLDGQVAAVLFQLPDCLGYVEANLAALIDAVHDAGALAIVSYYPFAGGLLKPPGELGADIVCGEAQCFGNPMAFGGPVLGYLACRKKLIRLLPGRLIGRTKCERRDNPGDEFKEGEGFVMTLQAREQHIRRDKASSNICTNQALMALRTCIYLGLVGRHGLRDLAQTCHDNANAACDKLTALAGVENIFPSRQFFNEFTLRFPSGKADEVYQRGIEARILAGIKPAGHSDCLTFAFTELHQDSDIDALVVLCQEVL